MGVGGMYNDLLLGLIPVVVVSVGLGDEILRLQHICLSIEERK